MPYRRLFPILALALCLAAFPLGMLAGHQFTDVPDVNPFTPTSPPLPMPA